MLSLHSSPFRRRWHGGGGRSPLPGPDGRRVRPGLRRDVRRLDRREAVRCRRRGSVRRNRWTVLRRHGSEHRDCRRHGIPRGLDGAGTRLRYGHYLRDPFAGYPSPGGCPGDADTTDVVEAALDSGVYLFGLALSRRLRSSRCSRWRMRQGRSRISTAMAPSTTRSCTSGTERPPKSADVMRVDAIDAERGLVLDVFTSVTLEVARRSSRDCGMVLAPASYCDMSPGRRRCPRVRRRLRHQGVRREAVVGSVEFALVGDGFDLATAHVDVEIAPL